MIKSIHQEAPLEELLEGLPIDSAIERARLAMEDICLSKKEPIKVPRNRIEEWMLENGATHRRVSLPWTDKAQQELVLFANESFEELRQLDEHFESTRRIVASWQPENKLFLPHTLDEYITELRNLEEAIYRQADEVEHRAGAVKVWMTASLEHLLERSS